MKKLYFVIFVILLLLTNFFWLYLYIDQLSIYKYTDIFQYEKEETVKQLVLIFPHISRGDNKQHVMKTLRTLFPDDEPFEKNGKLYSGYLEFIFDNEGSLNKVDESIKNAIVENSFKSCIPDSLFKIANLSYYSSKLGVIEQKGQPDTIIFNEFHNIESLIYSDLQVDLTNNHIFHFSTKSLNDSTPFGIHPGLSRNEVYQKLTENNIHLNNTELFEQQYVNCDKEYYLVLGFSHNGYLNKLEFGIDLP